MDIVTVKLIILGVWGISTAFISAWLSCGAKGAGDGWGFLSFLILVSIYVAG